MYKLIIVDDERQAAKLLETYINTYVNDFEVVGIFEDGIEVVKYLSEHGSVDAIITDIKMSKMSGIQLAQYIHDTKLDIKVIFVSSYDDFNYAKEAIKYGVYGYLLKVVDVDELVEMMKKLWNDLNNKNKQDIVDVELQRECFFENLLIEDYYENLDMNEELKKCQFGANPERFTCNLLKFTINDENYNDNNKVEKIELSLTGIIKCAMNIKYVCCVLQRKDMYYMVIVDESDSMDTSALQDIINDIFEFDFKMELIESKTIAELLKNKIKIPLLQREEKTEISTNEMERTKLISIACNYINSNLKNDISRDVIAKQIGLASVYFGRLFKSEMGVSFSDYVYKQRMLYAEKLLKNGFKTNEVCEQIGYLDERNFRRVFRQYSGMTPAEYRKIRGGVEQ